MTRFPSARMFWALLVFAGFPGRFSCARAAERLPFLLGADVSLAPSIEQAGIRFKDGGKPEDIFAIFRAHGANCVRLRLFVHPNGKDGVVNDLPYTLALAKRVKAAGLLLSLDFHYSDTWADPGHQATPAGWQGLTLPPLADRTREYTAGVLRACQEAGVLPDMVQIGNEITVGLLWPTGRLAVKDVPEDMAFDRVAVLLKAGAEGVRTGVGTGAMPKIMLHIDGGESRGRAQWFFDRLTRRGVPFDLVGLSYYPFNKGTLEDLRQTLAFVATTYHKPVAVVETAYLHADDPSIKPADRAGLTFPLTPGGQRDFLAALVKTVRETPEGLGAGVLYWYPESVPVRSAAVDGWYGGKAALFDAEGNGLPALGAFGRP